MASSINYQAGGNILPMTFVSDNPGIDFQVIQSDGTKPIVGISQMGTMNFPGGPGNQTYAAVSGGGTGCNTVAVFGDESHDEPLLTVSAAVTGGQMLKSDSSGYGIPVNEASATQQYVGAEARQSTLGATFPQNIRVRVRIYAEKPA